MSNKITLFLGILLAIYVVLYFRTCQSKPPDHSADKKEVDSLVEKSMKDSIISFKKIDSANHTIAVLSKTKDSLTQLLSITKGSLKVKDNDISGLIDQINTAEASNDTKTALAACDSLKLIYPPTKALVTFYIHQNDSLLAVNTQIIGAKDTIIGRLSGLFTNANNSLFDVSRKYSILEEDYTKVVKASNKRFGVGPQISVGVVGGKIAVLPAIGITYSLIRF